MTIKIAFSVDDVCPVPGYGLLKDNGPFLYLRKLHEEFGCKFTLFSIPLLDGEEKNDWRKNKNWCKYLKDCGYYEIAQHGLVHTAQKPEWGAQEFANLTAEECNLRIKEGKKILEKAGFDIKGFKPPGWFITKPMYMQLKDQKFNYVADHIVGNDVIYSPDMIPRVPYTFTINQIYHDKYEDVIILHSHISPKGGNLNAWNNELYENVRDYLNVLKQKDKLEFVFMHELVKE